MDKNKNKEKTDNRPSFDPYKSFANWFFGEKQVDKAGGGGTVNQGGKSKSKDLQELKRMIGGN